MGICSICGEEKQSGSKNQDKFTCNDCINSMEKHKCDICENQETMESYYVHLRTKHKPEELAKYISDRAREERDKLYDI